MTSQWFLDWCWPSDLQKTLDGTWKECPWVLAQPFKATSHTFSSPICTIIIFPLDSWLSGMKLYFKTTEWSAINRSLPSHIITIYLVVSLAPAQGPNLQHSELPAFAMASLQSRVVWQKQECFLATKSKTVVSYNLKPVSRGPIKQATSGPQLLTISIACTWEAEHPSGSAVAFFSLN